MSFSAAICWPLNESLILTSADGTIVRLDAATGKQLANFDTGEALCGKPVVFGRRLLVASIDGSIHALTIPH